MKPFFSTLPDTRSSFRMEADRRPGPEEDPLLRIRLPRELSVRPGANPGLLLAADHDRHGVAISFRPEKSRRQLPPWDKRCPSAFSFSSASRPLLASSWMCAGPWRSRRCGGASAKAPHGRTGSITVAKGSRGLRRRPMAGMLATARPASPIREEAPEGGLSCPRLRGRRAVR
jgi:hypothetical protein